MYSSRMGTTRCGGRGWGVSLSWLGGGVSVLAGGLCDRDLHPLPVNRMIHRCENITLPQTSLAGGNNNGHGVMKTLRMNRPKN